MARKIGRRSRARAPLGGALVFLLTLPLVACGGSNADSTSTGPATTGDTDVVTCSDGCSIGSACYPAGDHRSDASCQVCDPARNSSDWSDDDGAACDDGLYCTVNDECSGSVCGGVPRNCSDGVACNGEETCDDEDDVCEPGTSTCEADEICDVGQDACVTTCTGCIIGGSCYGREQVDPTNGCHICDPSEDPNGWSDNDGASCNDGDFCNGSDTCSAGDCSVHAGDPCSDDGRFCSGTESCDENNDICLHSGDPCPDELYCNGTEGCDEENDACVHSGDPCIDDLFCNGADSCDEDNDICVHSGDPCTDDLEFCNGTESCDEDNDTCVHSSDPCPDDLFCNGTESCDENNDICLYSGDPCPDEFFCNGTEACDEDNDVCLPSSGDPCSDDGVYCTGTEYCDDNADACLSTGSPCAGGENCFESVPYCCVPRVSQTCSGDDVAWVDSCGRTDEIAVVCGSDYTCTDARCVCAPGMTGENCDRETIFVDGSTGDDGNDGMTWNTALRTLTEALSRGGGGGLLQQTVIWVAMGTYYPTDGTDRNATFLVPIKTDLYGGFFGTESVRDQRDVELNPTILSGDIGTPGDPTDNVRHVVTITGSTVIDGFTITGGYGDNSSDDGGGIFNVGNATVVNCTFVDNSTLGSGGGMFNAGSATVVNCTFVDNSALRSGGGIFNPGNAMVANSTFVDNSALGDGGAVYTIGRLDVTGCTFSGNLAEGGGGAICSNYEFWLTVIEVTDSTFTDNVAVGTGGGPSECTGGGAMCISESDATLTGCTFSGNHADRLGGAIHNHQSSPTVTDCTFSNNVTTSHPFDEFGGGAMYNNWSSSPTVTGCTFSNNTGDLGSAMYNQGASSPTLTNCTFFDNTGWGAVYGGGSSTLTNCIFYGNAPLAFGYVPLPFPSEPGSPTVTNCMFIANEIGLDQSDGTLTNSIIWGNTNAQAWDLPTVTYSNIQGGIHPGLGNISQDPLFVDGDPSDGSVNLRVLPASPCIDTGNTSALPADTADLDGDGNYSEPIPLDLDGAVRVWDGDRSGTFEVDMGAYER